MPEITTAAEGLYDEMITRTDLGFVADGDDIDDLFFKPSRSLADNARKFMNDPALKERQQKSGALGPPAVSAILSAA